MGKTNNRRGRVIMKGSEIFQILMEKKGVVIGSKGSIRLANFITGMIASHNHVRKERDESERARTELIKQNQALAVENERLEAVIKAAQEQDPYGYDSAGDLVYSKEDGLNIVELIPLYTHPVPAQPPAIEFERFSMNDRPEMKPAVAVPDLRLEDVAERLANALSEMLRSMWTAGPQKSRDEFMKEGRYALAEYRRHTATAQSHDRCQPQRSSCETCGGSGFITFSDFARRDLHGGKWGKCWSCRLVEDSCPSHEPIEEITAFEHEPIRTQSIEDFLANGTHPIHAAYGVQDGGVVDHE